MISLIKKIIGSADQFTIEHRLLNASCMISIFFSIAILVNNIALGLDPFLNLIIGLAFIFYSILYYLSRIKARYTLPVWGLIIFFMLLLPAGWFLNSGLFGSTVYICFFIFSLFFIVVRGRLRLIVGGLFIVELAALIIIEYFYPQLVVTYDNREMQFTDIVINLVFSLALIGLLLLFMIKNYEEEKKKADESNRLKSFFLANISHEIRTPMNSILGFADLLRDGSLPDAEKKHYIEIINRSGRHLLGLIDDIIDLSRIEAGHVVINEVPFSVDSIMDDFFEMFRMQIKNERKDIEIRPAHSVEAAAGSIMADEFRIRQVLLNLMGNAVKFTDSGTIEFGYSVPFPGLLKFFVSDTGIGIARENITRIFQQFKQGDDSFTRKYGGAGLGLAISKKLVNLMGGDIWLDTELGKGTTFYFTVKFRPAEPDGAEPESAEPESAEPESAEPESAEPEGAEREGENKPDPDAPSAGKNRSGWKNRTVLVVEDDDQSYNFLERVLSRYGINVLRSDNGMDAVEKCRNNGSIGCVLMDIQLPFMSGNDAAKMIREIRKDLPIIAQSGNAYDTDRMDSINAGCNEFIAKPVLTDRLLEVLDRYL
ncbi:MAG: ATP-binding protein [Spirochaetes bacterium]|jgi:signal transduction histidine kinase|nr:ATP-binding protein [Spirochaetota bacterium]